MEPSHSAVVDNWASWIYEKKGMRAEAVKAVLSRDRGAYPSMNAEALRSAFRQEGWKPFWNAHARALRPYAKQQCNTYDIAVSYLEADERDLAFSELNKAVDQRCFWMIFIKVDPLLDELRTDKRYEILLRRINLP